MYEAVPGELLEKKHKLAAHWYTQAAKQSPPHAGALSALGLLYEVGRGVERDERKAMKLYRLAMQVDEVKDIRPHAHDREWNTEVPSPDAKDCVDKGHIPVERREEGHADGQKVCTSSRTSG